MSFTVEYRRGLVCVVCGDTIFKAWHPEAFTVRKLENYKNKLKSCYNHPIKFETVYNV